MVKISRRNVLFKKFFCRKLVIIILALGCPKKTAVSLKDTETIRLKGHELYEKKRYLA